VAREMFSIHLPTLDRPEGGKAWKLLRATMAEVLSKLSARPFFPGGTLPSGPLMPALPLCTIASIIRREWVAFSHIMPCLLVLVASIGALVLVAAVLSKFGSGSGPEEPGRMKVVRFSPNSQRVLRPAKAYAAARSSFSSPRITILSASSGNGRCSALASLHGAGIQTSRSSSVVRITGMAFGVADPH
jgi:hypothetical protein